MPVFYKKQHFHALSPMAQQLWKKSNDKQKSGCGSHIIVMKQGVKYHACILWRTLESMALSLKVYFRWLLIKVTTGGRDQLAWSSISMAYPPSFPPPKKKREEKVICKTRGKYTILARSSEMKKTEGYFNILL